MTLRWKLKIALTDKKTHRGRIQASPFLEAATVANRAAMRHTWLFQVKSTNRK